MASQAVCSISISEPGGPNQAVGSKGLAGWLAGVAAQVVLTPIRTCASERGSIAESRAAGGKRSAPHMSPGGSRATANPPETTFSSGHGHGMHPACASLTGMLQTWYRCYTPGRLRGLPCIQLHMYHGTPGQDVGTCLLTYPSIYVLTMLLTRRLCLCAPHLPITAITWLTTKQPAPLRFTGRAAATATPLFLRLRFFFFFPFLASSSSYSPLVREKKTCATAGSGRGGMDDRVPTRRGTLGCC